MPANFANFRSEIKKRKTENSFDAQKNPPPLFEKYIQLSQIWSTMSRIFRCLIYYMVCEYECWRHLDTANIMPEKNWHAPPATAHQNDQPNSFILISKFRSESPPVDT